MQWTACQITLDSNLLPSQNEIFRSVFNFRWKNRKIIKSFVFIQIERINCRWPHRSKSDWKYQGKFHWKLNINFSKRMKEKCKNPLNSIAWVLVHFIVHVGIGTWYIKTCCASKTCSARATALHQCILHIVVGIAFCLRSSQRQTYACTLRQCCSSLITHTMRMLQLL